MPTERRILNEERISESEVDPRRTDNTVLTGSLYDYADFTYDNTNRFYSDGIEKKSTKAYKSSDKMKDPYLSIIQNEYQLLISESEKFGIVIPEEKKNLIKSNIEILNKLESDLKKIFEESNKKQKESKDAIDLLKEELSDVLNSKKFDECMSKAQIFIDEKNWASARACYDNALYYTKSKRDDVKVKISELNDIQSKEVVKTYITDINYYLAQANNTILNRIIDRTYSIDFKFIVGEDLETFKRIYSNIPNAKKVNLISAILDNKSFKPDMKLGIL